MKPVQKLAIVFAVALVLLAAAVAWLAGTNQGIRSLLWLASRTVSHFSYGAVEGNLFSLRITNLQYSSPGVSLRMGDVQWRLLWKEIFSKRVHLRDLKARDVTLDMDSSQWTSSEPQTAPLSWNLHSWEALLENVTIDSLQAQFNGQSVSWTNLNMGVLVNQSALSFFSPSISDFRYEPAARQNVEKKEKEAIGARLRQWAQTPLIGQIMHWSIPVPVAVYDGSVTNIDVASLNIHAATFGVSAKVEQSRVDIVSARIAEPRWGEIRLEGAADFSQDVPLGIHAYWTPAASLTLPFSTLEMKLDGKLAQQIELSASLQGSISSSLMATAALTRKGTPFSVSVKSPLLGFSTGNGDLYSAQEVSVEAKGTLDDVTVRAQSSLFIPGLSDALLDVTARCNINQADITAEIRQKSAGKIRVAGSAFLKDALQAAAKITVDSWDLFSLAGIRQHTDISGSADVSGTWSTNDWNAKLSQVSLGGKIGTSQLSLQSAAQINSRGLWQLTKFDANVGSNHVVADGRLQGNEIKASLAVKAPNLHQIDLRFMGRLMADIDMQGSVERPVLSGEVTADNIGAFGAAARQVHIVAKSQLENKNLTGDFRLTAQDLSVRGIALSELKADLIGDVVHHRSDISWKAPTTNGSIRLSGGWDGKTGWKGELLAAHIDSAVGPWSLQQSVPLSFSLGKKTLRVAMHCWSNPNADICLAQDAQVGSVGKATVEIRRWSFGMLHKWLPSDISLKGNIAGMARVVWNANAALPVQGSIQLDGQSLSIHRKVDTKDISLTVENISASVAGDLRSLHLSWSVLLDDQSAADGQIVISDPLKKAALSGHIAFRALSLSRINILLEQGDHVQGMVTADIALSGSLHEPLASGSIQAESLLLTSSKMPFVMKPSHLRITLNGRNSQLEGVIQSQRGALQLTGSAQWPQASAWSADLRVQGKSFAIFVRPYVHAVIDPDITINASMGFVKVAGEVTVPEALARVNDLPSSAVAASQDEVMLDAAYRPIVRSQPPLPVFLDVGVKLGDRVDVRAFGLRTRLAGTIRILQDDKGLTSTGKIELKDGRFTSYGQDLEVRKGEFSFAGSPTDPILTVEAIRNPESTEDGVTAGVRITGRASKPKVVVFADPAQPQQTALSYLLTGSAGDTQGKDKNAAMTSMLIGLGASSAGQMIGALGSSIGIEDLTIGTEGTGTESEVVVSGYLLPGLQVKYGVGIFDSLATITLRYRLMPQFYVEVATGLEQAVSLLYEFDF